jgi:hypothetical protein
LIFAYGKWVASKDFVELFQAVVGIAVSLIPEGLPALITITLAISSIAYRSMRSDPVQRRACSRPSWKLRRRRHSRGIPYLRDKILALYGASKTC